MNRFEQILMRWQIPSPGSHAHEEIRLLCEYVKAAEEWFLESEEVNYLCLDGNLDKPPGRRWDWRSDAGIF